MNTAQYLFYFYSIQGFLIEVAIVECVDPEQSEIWKQLQANSHKYNGIGYKKY